MKIHKILQEIKFNEFISIDLETTGLNSDKDEIIEISAIRFVNGEIKDEFTKLIKPTIPIPKKITSITGINDSMVSNAPKIADIFQEFLFFLDNKIIVAHNIDFDISFIERYASDLFLDFKIAGKCDTLSLTRSFFYNFDKFNLEYLSKVFEFDHSNAHRARNDAVNCGKLLMKLISQISSMPLSVIDKVKSLCLDNMNNSLLYANIYKMRKTFLDNEFNPIKKLDLKSNVIINKKGSNDPLLDSLDSWFNENGKLAKSWPKYSKRDIQLELTKDIYNNFSETSSFVAEAGAGLGKSLAYLIAGLKYSYENDKTLIISTFTKALQDQLFNKDIPILINSLNLNMKVVILKGRNNYISKSKLDILYKSLHENNSITEINECITLTVWSYFTKSGDIEECKGFNKERIGQLWNNLSYSNNIENININSNDYYNNTIKELKNADIIIVNHSLLCSDISNESPNLPKKATLVIDEGHNLKLSIKNQLLDKFSDSYLLSLIYNYKNIINNFSDFSNDDSMKNIKKIKSLLNLTIKDISSSFDIFKENYDNIYLKLDYNKFDISINNDDFLSNGLDFDLIMESLDKIKKKLELTLKEIEDKNILTSINNLMKLKVIDNNLNDIMKIIKRISKNNLRFVKWISLYRRGVRKYISFSVLDTDIRNFIYSRINKFYPSYLICSATITINNSFNFFFNSLGIDNNILDFYKTNIYNSPFYYEEQSKFYVYNKKIEINSDDYLTDVSNQIASISTKLNKKILILCTSYKQVNSIGNNLKHNVKIDSNNLYIQTSKFSKNLILDNYKKSQNGILVGTSTFWEGIDLPGNLLEILFIVRVPFGNPTNPYTQFLNNQIQSINGNPFYDLELPKAILKIKQGFGRLIRSDRDTGVCIFTDPRICNSSYGSFIIDEFPVLPDKYQDINEIINEIDNFLGK